MVRRVYEASDEIRQKAYQRLRSQMDNCRLCLEHGYWIFPRAIYSGSLDARIMVVGQAPGVTEMQAGRPFNAGSGSRLFKWLAGAGIEENWFRTTQYMCSVTKCYPGRAKAGSGDRTPSRAEQSLCRPYLLEEITLVDPRLILPVGRLAISLWFDPPFSLDDIIGQERQVDGRWVIPLPHPSGASRWHQSDLNRERVAQAVELIGTRVAEIYPGLLGA